jgi:CarD family transcriptional regulator
VFFCNCLKDCGRDDILNYKVGNVVLYGTQGVCRIDKISERIFNNTPALYYVLKPIHDDRSIIYVPVHNEAAASKLRQILSVQEVHDIIRSMPGENTVWIRDDKIRKATYKTIISGGDRKELAKLIKMFYLLQQEQTPAGKGKKLNVADERFMKDAEKILYEEFSYVLNIKPEQVGSFITEQIVLEEKAKP